MIGLLTERLFRRALIAIALAGLVLGGLAWAVGDTKLANWCWAAGTFPVVLGLLTSMIHACFNFVQPIQRNNGNRPACGG